MPFKTKRQKIAASARRFTFDQTQFVYDTKERPKSQDDVKLEKIPTVKKVGVLRKIDDLGYVTGDLIKIVAIALVILGTQVILGKTLF